MKSIFLSIVMLFAIGISNSDAQAVKREIRQHKRIKQGVQTGELTPAEAANLHKDEKKIHQEVKDAKADGVVTPSERREIRKDQNKESRKIYRKKHNARVNP